MTPQQTPFSRYKCWIRGIAVFLIFQYERFGCAIHGIPFTGDQWEVLWNGHWTGVPSPVAQNERHILVLKDLIAGCKWAPRYFNMIKQSIRYINVVAVPPECGIRGRDSGVMVVSMDNLIKRIRADWSGFFSPSLFSDITAAQLRQLGRNLVACHRPARFDFASA
jgi:hypothetical protein